MRAITIPREVALAHDLSGDAKILYGHILALSYRDGYCWATNQWFATTFGVSERTVKRWVAELVGRGLLAVTDATSKKRRMTPTVGLIAAANRARSVPVNRDRTDPVTGTDLSGEPGQNCPPTNIYSERDIQNENAGTPAHESSALVGPDGRNSFGDASAALKLAIDAFVRHFEGTAAVMPKTMTTGLIQQAGCRVHDLRREGIPADADYWDRLLGHLAKSDFLTGRIAGRGGRPFRLRLNKLLEEEFFADARAHAYCDAETCTFVGQGTSRPRAHA